MFEKTIQSPHGMGELKAIFETFSATYNETVGVSSEYKLTETVGKTETSDTSFNILNLYILQVKIDYYLLGITSTH